MKIFFDIRTLANKRISGIDEYTRLLVSHMLDIDRDNKYEFFTNGLKKQRLPESLTKKRNVSFINWRIPNKIFDFTSLGFHFPKIDSFSNADVFFSPHFNLLNISKKTKRIIIFHDLSFVHFPEWYSAKRRAWHKLQNCKRQINEATKLVTVSDFTANDIINTFSVPKDKVRRIYSGINTFYKKLPTNDVENFRKRKKLEAPFLLFVGVLEPRKNIVGIIKSFSVLKEKKKFKNLKLILAGKNGWLCDTIFKEAKESQFNKDIIFWGEASFEDLRFLYNACEVFIYPSFFEGFGFPPLEAQICGAPVVVSNRSSFPEIIGNSGIMVNPRRIDEQVDAIKSLLENKPFRDAYINKGFENVKKFSWKNTAQEMLSLINSLVKNA